MEHIVYPLYFPCFTNIQSSFFLLNSTEFFRSSYHTYPVCLLMFRLSNLSFLQEETQVNFPSHLSDHMLLQHFGLLCIEETGLESTSRYLKRNIASLINPTNLPNHYSIAYRFFANIKRYMLPNSSQNNDSFSSCR